MEWRWTLDTTKSYKISEDLLSSIIWQFDSTRIRRVIRTMRCRTILLKNGTISISTILTNPRMHMKSLNRISKRTISITEMTSVPSASITKWIDSMSRRPGGTYEVGSSRSEEFDQLPTIRHNAISAFQTSQKKSKNKVHRLFNFEKVKRQRARPLFELASLCRGERVNLMNIWHWSLQEPWGANPAKNGDLDKKRDQEYTDTGMNLRLWPKLHFAR